MVPVCRKIAPREAYFRQGSDPLPRKKVRIRIWQKETHPEIRHTALGKDCGVRWNDLALFAIFKNLHIAVDQVYF